MCTWIGCDQFQPFERFHCSRLFCWTVNLAVAPEHRRKRIATGLLERLFELTGGEGRRGYTLEVRVSNDVAIRLYEQAGFKARGVRRGYYTDNREDALIMWRDFEPRPT